MSSQRWESYSWAFDCWFGTTASELFWFPAAFSLKPTSTRSRKKYTHAKARYKFDGKKTVIQMTIYHFAIHQDAAGAFSGWFASITVRFDMDWTAHSWLVSRCASRHLSELWLNSNGRAILLEMLFCRFTSGRVYFRTFSDDRSHPQLSSRAEIVAMWLVVKLVQGLANIGRIHCRTGQDG